MSDKDRAESVVRQIRRKTRRKYSAEENIRIVLERLRGEDSIAESCRREGINPNLYYKWSKEFLEAGKHRLKGGRYKAGSNQFSPSEKIGRCRVRRTTGRPLMAIDLSPEHRC